MTRLHLTPWAAQRLTDDDRSQIAVIAPEGSVVSIGAATGQADWTARILVSDRVIGEGYGCRTPMSAFLLAMSDYEAKAAA